MTKLSSKTRNSLPKEDFAEPGKRKYPIENKSHAANAKARASEMENKGKISASEKSKIDSKANRVLDNGKRGSKG